MDILFLLIPLSIALAFLIGLAFWWSVRSGQFDDLILDDDDALDEHDPGERRQAAGEGRQDGQT